MKRNIEFAPIFISVRGDMIGGRRGGLEKPGTCVRLSRF